MKTDTTTDGDDSGRNGGNWHSEKNLPDPWGG